MFAPTLTDTGRPITYGAAGAPHIFWRAPNVTPEPFVPVDVVLDNAQALPWTKVGDYYWSRFQNGTATFMGLHLTQRTVAPGMIECALHVPNAVCDPKRADSFCGAVRYYNFQILTPAGWKIAHEFPMQAPGAHFWPSLMSRTFRFVLYRAPGTREQAGRVLECKHVEFNETLPMGPQRTPIAPGTGWWDDAMKLRMVGPVRLCGQPTPWAHGGTGIGPLHCAPLSSENALRHRELADAAAASGLCVAYHEADGHPIMPAEWGEPPGWEYLQERGEAFNQRIPIFTRGRTDDYARSGQDSMESHIATLNPAGQFWADKSLNEPNGCPYEWALRQEYAKDKAHFCRQYQDDLTIAVLLDDTIAKLRLRAYAADAMLSWNLKHSPGLWSGSFTLEKALAQAKAAPAKGGIIPRAQGWSYHPAGAALIFAPPGSPERAYMIRWAGVALDYAATSRTPSYMPQDGWPGSDDNLPWAYGLAQDEHECPSWQVPLWATGVYGLAMAAHGARTSQRVKDLVVLSAELLYGDPGFFVPDLYVAGAVGPPQFVRTSKAGVFDARLTRGVGEPNAQGRPTTNTLHAWHHCALAALWGNKDVALMLARQVRTPSADNAALKAKLSPVSPWDQALRAVLS